MEKRLKAKDDTADLLVKMQHQIFLLEGKIDTLIGLASRQPAAAAHHPQPFQRPDHSNRPNEIRQNNGFRDRVLHKAICADCNKACEVPFRPSGDRPVYCKECFSKRKTGGSFKAGGGSRPEEAKLTHEKAFHKHHIIEGRKSRAKRKAAPKKSRKR